MLDDLSLAQEGRRLCEEEWIFRQDNAAIHNALIAKKYLLELNVRLLDHPGCSPDLNPKDYFSLLQKFMKVVDSTQQFLKSKTHF